MDWNRVEEVLAGSGLAALRTYDRVDSTNAEAARWLEEGAPHLSLVLADHQTAGRGRAGRKWYTLPGTALALSLILKGTAITGSGGRPQPLTLHRLPGLGAVAVSQALETEYGLRCQVKWPNDVLIGGKKIAGILVETVWLGERLDGVVIGIGINVLSAAVPPGEELAFPATSLEACMVDTQPDRIGVLQQVVGNLLTWLPRLNSDEFLEIWESRLAWRGERVQILRDATDNSGEMLPILQGRLSGLDEAGRLRLLGDDGRITLVEAGELRLRPAG
jgi:BirA family transcriptional regulator, biotin operon repressor / biotin---[acetyl-CoA-carboxylase] ligase